MSGIALLLVLAHKCEGMVRRVEAKDYAEIARRMGLTRARVTQVCSLVNIDPAVQDAILTGSLPVSAVACRRLRFAARFPLWVHQIQRSAQLP